MNQPADQQDPRVGRGRTCRRWAGWLTTALAVACAAPAAASAQGDSASGVGTFGCGAVCEFEFTAASAHSGEGATGSIHVQFTHNGSTSAVTAAVDCINATGTSAQVAGVVTSSKGHYATVPVGSRMQLEVEDNGTPGAGADGISHHFDSHSTDCSMRVFNLTPITSGEIAVTDGASSPADGDRDGVADGDDNCATEPNADQADWDNDGQGDVCDDDKPPAQAISDMIEAVEHLPIHGGIKTSLSKKLQAALKSYNSAGQAAACGKLDSFTHELRAQSDKKVTETEAQALIAEAVRIKAAIDC